MGAAIKLSIEADPKSVTVEARGTHKALSEVANSLVWLCAAVRKSNIDGLAYSTITSGIWRTATFNNGLPVFIPPKLQSPPGQTVSCWHPLFLQGVTAAECPIPERREGIGLEISFEIMTRLSGIPRVTVYNGTPVLIEICIYLSRRKG
jgi:hypothetical protein